MNKKVYSFLLKTYGRQPGYWVGLAAVIAQTLLLRVVAVIIIARIAANLVAGDLAGAKVGVAWYLGIAILGLLLRLAREWAAVRAEGIAYKKIVVAYYQKLVGKDMAFFRDHQTGYLATTFRQHGDSAMDLVRLIRGEFIQTVITLTVPTAVLLFASWKVGLAVLAVIIVQVLYIRWASASTNPYRVRSHEIYRKVSGLVSDDVTNIVAYKTSGVARKAVDRLRAFMGEELDIYWRRRKLLALLDAPRDMLTIIGTAAAFWLIIGNVESTSESVGLLVLTVTYMFQIFQSITHVSDLIVRHDDLVTKLYPTLEYLTDKDETIKDPAKPQKFTVNKGQIDIENVHFAYHDGKGNKTWVFKGLDLHIRGGEQVGIVGLSGAGKSTLASLLMRFDDIESGSIMIDGVDIREIRQADLRQHIAYVPQEPLLFHRTIKENLQYFGADSSDVQIIRAAKAAHAHEFIAKMPGGYDTLVGERGIKLSGGQKQRVVIARAILKNAPIMLFDEATSALDSESEKIIQKALPEIIGKRTAIIIAHRLSTIVGLDRIIVMHDGKIIEQGTHEELLAFRGRYHSLWQKQTAQEKALAVTS